MVRKSYSPEEIGRIIDAGTRIDNPDAYVSELLIDSRRLIYPETTLFFALNGQRHNGHDFIEDLYQAGVRNFVVSHHFDEMPGANFFLVTDTLKALQQLAARHRSSHSLDTIAITGSNGKTTVKEWLYQIYGRQKRIVRSPRSYNSQIGVPLSVWNINETCDLGIFEAGISMPGEMDKLEPIIRPDTGIFTNIGEAHQKNFESLQQKALEKCKLFRNATLLFYCRDHDTVHQAVRNALPEIETCSWGTSEESDIRIISTLTNNNHTTLKAEYAGTSYTATIPFADRASIENACHCLAYMIRQGETEAFIADRLARLEPVEMRLEQKNGLNNTILINDTYNSDINSLEIALAYAGRVHPGHPKTLILSDIPESGQNKTGLYQRVNELLTGYGFRRLVGVGQDLSRMEYLFDIEEKHFFADTDELLFHLAALHFSNETILIKGARSFKFERVVKALEKQSHRTRLEVNLDNLVRNFNYFRGLLNNGVRTMAMVKAFAYGTGSLEVAHTLSFHGVDYLGVAYADEGVILRKGGITGYIMVMNPQISDFSTIINHRLEPEIYSFEMLDAFASEIDRLAVQTEYPVHIKLDTGMNRLGFRPEEVSGLIDKLCELRQLKVISVFSHFAASDEATHDTFSRQQMETFSQNVEQITRAIGYDVIRHMANSAGVIRFPEAQFDMVRLGIGLYGIGADDDSDKNLLPVMSLRSTIVQVKNVKKGETIGYNRKGIARENMTIAIVPAGYADGIDRRLSNGVGQVYIKGHYCPIAGQVCMDLTMIDITGKDIRPGDDVEFFGMNLSLQSVARWAETIPYEIIARIPQRVKRVYFKEDT